MTEQKTLPDLNKSVIELIETIPQALDAAYNIGIEHAIGIVNEYYGHSQPFVNGTIVQIINSLTNLKKKEA